MTEQIKLNSEEVERKKIQIEELELKMEGGNLQVELLKKEIELNLPIRQKQAQIKSILSQIENDKKNKETLENQIKDWK